MALSKVAEKTVFKVAEEYARRLGVPLPEVVVQRGMGMFPWTARDGRNGGVCYSDHITINRMRSLKYVRNSIAHELIHRAFPHLRHGPVFERYVRALQAGGLFFRGRTTARGKVAVLDDEVPPRPQSYSEKASIADARIKEIDIKIKRLRTARRKWVLRQKAWRRRQAAPAVGDPASAAGRVCLTTIKRACR